MFGSSEKYSQRHTERALPLVTVIVPTFNGEATLPALLESLEGLFLTGRIA